MRPINRRKALGMMGSAAGLTVLNGIIPRRAFAVPGLSARVIAMDIPGASAIAQIGTFLNDPAACAHPIPTNFPLYIQRGAVLDPKRILVGSSSNFGAPLAIGVGQEGAFLSIDPGSSHILRVPREFANRGDQASTLGGLVQMFSANSPFWLNSKHNPDAVTGQYTGVSNRSVCPTTMLSAVSGRRTRRLARPVSARLRSLTPPANHSTAPRTRRSAASTLAV